MTRRGEASWERVVTTLDGTQRIRSWSSEGRDWNVDVLGDGYESAPVVFAQPVFARDRVVCR